MKIIVQVILVISAGLLAALLATPYLYRALPSDFERTALIINTLNNPSGDPEVILFGNSILMSGIDALTLRDNLAGEPLTFNLSSTGQQLTESILYYEMLPPNVTTVVQFIRAEQTSRPPDSLSDIIAGNLRMYGYEPGPSTKALMPAKMLSYFDASWWKANFDARVIVPNSINRSMRSLLRKDLDLAGVAEELYFPNVYESKLNEQEYAKLVARYNPTNALNTFTPDKATLSLLKKAASSLSERNIRFVVVIYPINPRLNNFTNAYRNGIGQFVKSDVKGSLDIIDLSGAVRAADFIDHWHISRDGAVKLSKKLATKLSL